MNPARYICTAAAMMISSWLSITAQEQARSDTQDRFRITPTYGVFYTQEIGLMGMGGFTGTYRGTGGAQVPSSTMSVSLALSTRLFLMTAVNGIWYSACTHSILKGLRIRYDASARYMPERFYGIGYECGQAGDYGEFRNMAFRLKSDYMFKAGPVRIGPVLGFDMMRLDSFTDTVFDEDYTEHYTSFMAGLAAELDTRDEVQSPSRGVFLDFRSTVSPSFGSGTGFHNTLITDFYIPLWKKGCLAADICGDFSSRDAWWMQWGTFGGDSRMRGYYTGRYRDRNIVSAQIELRHWFTGVHGAVAWGGAGTVFPDFTSFDVSRLLPTFGAGYRLRLYGILFRTDIGFGSAGQWAVSVGLGHAF